MQFLRNSRRSIGVLASLIAVLVVANVAFAAGHLTGGEVDYSAEIATGAVGLLAGVAASILGAIAVAFLIRASFKGARLALRAFGMIK